MLIPQIPLPDLRTEPPFRAWYIPFTQEQLFPKDRNMIKELGYDATSSFRRQRGKILALLRSAGPSSGFEPRDIRLLLVSGKETFAVDVRGRVLTGGKAKALPVRTWKELRLTLATSFPQFDLLHEIGEEDDPKPKPKSTSK